MSLKIEIERLREMASDPDRFSRTESAKAISLLNELEKLFDYDESPDGYFNNWLDWYHGTPTLREAFNEGMSYGAKRVLDNLPKWKPAAAAYEKDRLPRIDHSLNRLVARDEDGCFYIPIDELYKLHKECK